MEFDGLWMLMFMMAIDDYNLGVNGVYQSKLQRDARTRIAGWFLSVDFVP